MPADPVSGKNPFSSVDGCHSAVSLTWQSGEGNGNHASILAWRIKWTEEPGRLQSMGLQRVGHNWATITYMAENREAITLTKALILVWRSLPLWPPLMLIPPKVPPPNTITFWGYGFLMMSFRRTHSVHNRPVSSWMKTGKRKSEISYSEKNEIYI